MSVTVDSPKTPVTAGSHGVAAATVPNVCKMPGPPAPFVPTPLPNIGRSEDSPKGYSKNVRIESKAVAIKGASFKSVGDIASKATGGGIVSANTHGPTQFVGPGAMDVKMEGKNVHLLGDPMLNNCAGGEEPANAATLLGVIQNCGPVIAVPEDVCTVCGKTHEAFQESEATTADASTLATNFKAAVKPAVQSGVSSPQTMLGVVHCKCGKKYADQSGLTTVELCEAAKGMKHPSGVTTSYKDGASRDAAKNTAEAAMVGRMRAHLKNSPAFRTRPHRARPRGRVARRDRPADRADRAARGSSVAALLSLVPGPHGGQHGADRVSYDRLLGVHGAGGLCEGPRGPAICGECSESSPRAPTSRWMSWSGTRRWPRGRADGRRRSCAKNAQSGAVR
ncbi:DUF4150 domain-containing protein [Nannocystis sp. ILAH1]|uniref:PAAR-like domain-containing protein n=1 Tax=Nannocystis sp. ILAH1 TaxID=2996789 RepID=UPI0022716CC5|nr:PAAR-like domain-containing protein [Nannocystis sp. ILAH1]MCY0989761.1 DUF4150 domain-containing protein [Nannocystis sp. ILAH1]